MCRFSGLILAGLVVMCWSTFSLGQDIRHFDFRNFEYPWNGPPEGSDHLEWLSLSAAAKVHLTDGRWIDPEQAEERSKYGLPFSGLVLESVESAELTGSGGDAVVVLRYDTGGTQYSHFVYIYSDSQGPKLRGYFHTGDRSHSGLYRVYAKDKLLFVELYDPRKATGDCCSSGFVRTRYRWDGAKFEEIPTHQFGTTTSPSRTPVSTFGLPQQP